MIDVIHKPNQERTPGRKKQATHERIVEVAARAIRRSGYAGVTVADVMNEAGLTHGGFYAHFPSREAMLAEAADRAGAESVATAVAAAAHVSPNEALQAMVDTYLSKAHVENAETGCPIAALGSEMPRQSPEVRRAATNRMKEMVDVIARQFPDWGETSAHERALTIMSTMVGTLMIARAVDDPILRDALIRSAKNLLAVEPG